MPPRMWTGIPENVIEEDFALPAQFHRMWHQSRAISAERSLAYAVLWQALFDLQKFRFAERRRQQRLFWEAYDWVSSDDRTWPYSFGSLCETLGIDVNAARASLLSLDQPAVTPSEFAEAA